MIGVMIVAFVLAELAALSWTQGWFVWLLSGEAVVAGGLYFVLRRSLARARWPASE